VYHFTVSRLRWVLRISKYITHSIELRSLVQCDLTDMFAPAGVLLVLTAVRLEFHPGQRLLSDQMLEGTAAD
jgi:hypothetical protein